MKNNQVSIRFEERMARRLDSCSEKFGRSNPQTLLILSQEFLPVLESGIYGTPIWDILKRKWDDDLEEVRKSMALAADSVAIRRTAPG